MQQQIQKAQPNGNHERHGEKINHRVVWIM
jgi:hypothetical protein